MVRVRGLAPRTAVRDCGTGAVPASPRNSESRARRRKGCSGAAAEIPHGRGHVLAGYSRAFYRLRRSASPSALICAPARPATS